MDRTKTRFPGEWEPHEATICAWPFPDDSWFGDIGAVFDEMAKLIMAIAADEPVKVLVRDFDTRQSAEKMLRGVENIELVDLPYDDVWLRDSGPIFVEVNKSHLGLDWEFNGWGNKFPHDTDRLVAAQICKRLGYDSKKINWVLEGGGIDGNGSGILLTTSSCLLNPNRQPSSQKKELEQVLKEELGVDQIVWLDQGLSGDHTDGHIDTLARFCDAQTIVSCTAEEDDENHQVLESNWQVLKNFADQSNLRLIGLPIPQTKRTLPDGTRLPMTYANFYMTNRSVFVPQYDDPMDGVALKILKDVFATRNVYGLQSQAIIRGGGSFHCLTQQVPLLKNSL